MESREISLALVLLAAVVIYVTGCGSAGSSLLSNSAASPTSSPAPAPAPSPSPSPTPSPAPTPTPAPSPAPSPSPAPTPDPTPGTPAAGGVTISKPANGASVSSPFTLSASASTCSSQTVTSIGYGLDSATKTVANGGSINARVSASAGSHTVNVTAWGSNGAACSASVSVKVAAAAAAPPSPISSLIPSNAIGVSFIEGLSNWQAKHDPVTGGASSGTTVLVSSPALINKARQFNSSFSGSGGEIYDVIFDKDVTSTNFFYDAWVYLTSSAKTIGNLEMDTNQVVANGDTIIYGFQCDGYSGTWDYTENTGSPSSPHDTWIHSSAPCNVRKWAVNTWHHIQISYSRTAAGNVTYNSVWLDGIEAKIDATVPSAFALGWPSSLVTNFQVDGLGSGSNTVYLNKLTISRW